MGLKLHTLLGYEQPTKKLVAIKRDGDKTLEYLAVKTKEQLNVYNTDGECIASILNSKLASGKIKSMVAGDYEEYGYLMGLDGVTDDEGLQYVVEGFTVESGSKSKVKKVTSLDYEVHGASSKATYDVAKHGNSVEDFLYQVKTMDEVIAEKRVEELEKREKAKLEGKKVKEPYEPFNLDWTKEKNYRVLWKEKDIMEWLEGLKKTNVMVGFDTETTGLNCNSSKKDILVGICMSYEDNAGVYFPLEHLRMENVEMGKEKFLELLKPYIDRNSVLAKDLVTHNGAFDWRVLKMHDIDINIVYDTYIMYSILKIDTAKYVAGLKAIASKYLGIDVIELIDMYHSRTTADIESVHDAVFNLGLPVNEQTRYKLERNAEWKETLRYDFRFASKEFVEIYGSADADFPRLIHKLLEKEWDNDLDYIYRLEINVIPALGVQEYYGVKAKEEDFQVLYEDAVKEMKDLEVKIYEEAGHEFLISSPDQKRKVIFEELGLPILDRFYNKKGNLSTDKAVMETLAGYKNKDGSPMYPIIPLIQRYTKLNTLVNGFYGKLPQLIHSEHLYPTYKAMGAETGRISCSKPNLQQTEPSCRDYMTVDSDEYYFLVCDYSQVEYRIMAGMSGEKKVVDFFASNPEADYHIMAVSNMMGIPYEDVTSKQRKVGKTLNFGTTYGLQDENLALKLYGNTTPMHQTMARQARESYFAGIPTLRDYFEEVRDKAQVKGYTETMFGRRRAIHEFKIKNAPEYKIAAGRRKAGNMPVQGTAADLQKMAMTRVYEGFRKRGHMDEDARIVMNIHDEMVVQIKKTINPWYALYIMREAMEMDFSDRGFPPLYVGGNVGYNWKDGKRDDLEAPVVLMDEKVAEVKEYLANGGKWEDLPYYDDPRQMWWDAIREFSVKQIQVEIEKHDLKTLDDMHKCGRCINYAKRFNNPNTLMAVVKKHGWKVAYKNLVKIENKENDIVYTPKDDHHSGEGKEVKESLETVQDQVNKIINIDGKKITIKMEMGDADLFTVLDKMLIDVNHDYDDRYLFKSKEFYTIYLELGGHEPEKVRGKQLPKGFIPLLEKYVANVITGVGFGYYEDEIQEMDAKLIKEEYLVPIVD